TTRPPSTPLFPYTTLFRSYTIPDCARKIFDIDRADDGNDPISRGPKAGIVQLVGGTLNPDVWIAAKDHVAAYAANNPDRWTSIRSEEHTSELQSQSNLVCR